MKVGNLDNLNKINIILGKNGCGKSTILKNSEAAFSGDTSNGNSIYITPERGGVLEYQGGIEQNIYQNRQWLSNERRKNQSSQFRQQSATQFRVLETLVLRRLFREKRVDDDPDFYLEKINSLLDNIELRKNQLAFDIFLKGETNTTKLASGNISSGESELISLGIEALVFAEQCQSGKGNVLFLDEPDVHLHPDLQNRLIKFLIDLVKEYDFNVVIATHSTAILGSLNNYDNVNVAFMKSGDSSLKFEPITEVHRKVLPVFGAHPLSNIFNSAPILLVEGEDDERIWQQAIRTSTGRISVYPCSVGGIGELNKYEEESRKLIESIYDNGIGYSLRDRDDGDGNIPDIGCIKRFSLKCRSAENMLLSNEVLKFLGCDWENLKSKIIGWLNNNSSHPHFDEMKRFSDSGFDRVNFDLKLLRNDLMHIIGNSKPWEVAVGQVLANVRNKDNNNFTEDGSIMTYLGEDIVSSLFPKE